MTTYDLSIGKVGLTSSEVETMERFSKLNVSDLIYLFEMDEIELEEFIMAKQKKLNDAFRVFMALKLYSKEDGLMQKKRDVFEFLNIGLNNSKSVRYSIAKITEVCEKLSREGSLAIKQNKELVDLKLYFLSVGLV
jgi:hypothetical protein